MEDKKTSKWSRLGKFLLKLLGPLVKDKITKELDK